MEILGRALLGAKTIRSQGSSSQISPSCVAQGAFFHRAYGQGFWVGQFLYWVSITALMITRKKWIDVALLVVLCFTYVGGAIIFGW